MIIAICETPSSIVHRHKAVDTATTDDHKKKNNEVDTDDSSSSTTATLPITIHHSPYDAYQSLPPSLRSHTFAYSSSISVGSQSVFLLYSKVPPEQQITTNEDDDDDDDDDDGYDHIGDELDGSMMNNNENIAAEDFTALTPSDERARILKIRKQRALSKKRKQNTSIMGDGVDEEAIDDDDPRFALVPPAKRKQLIQLEKQERAARLKKKQQKLINAAKKTSSGTNASSFSFGGGGATDHSAADQQQQQLSFQKKDDGTTSSNVVFAPGDRSWNILIPQQKFQDPNSARYSNWFEHNGMKKFNQKYQQIHHALPAHQQLRSSVPIMDEIATNDGDNDRNDEKHRNKNSKIENQQHHQALPLDPSSRRKILDDYGIHKEKSAEDFWNSNNEDHDDKNSHHLKSSLVRGAGAASVHHAAGSKKTISFHVDGISQVQDENDDEDSSSKNTSSDDNSDSNSDDNESNVSQDSALVFTGDGASGGRNNNSSSVTMKNQPVSFLCRYHNNSGLRFRTRCDALVAMSIENQRAKLLSFLRKEVKSKVLEGHNFEIRLKRTNKAGFAVTHWMYDDIVQQNIKKEQEEEENESLFNRSTARTSEFGYSVKSGATSLRRRASSISSRKQSFSEKSLNGHNNNNKNKPVLPKTFIQTIYDDLKSELDERAVVLDEKHFTSNNEDRRNRKDSADSSNNKDASPGSSSPKKAGAAAAGGTRRLSSGPSTPLSPTQSVTSNRRSSSSGAAEKNKEVFKTALGVSIAFVTFSKETKEMTSLIDLLSTDANEINTGSNYDPTLNESNETDNELFRSKELSTLLHAEIENQRHKFLKTETEEEKAKRKKTMSLMSAKERATAMANMNKPSYHHQRSNQIMRICTPGHPSRGFTSKYLSNLNLTSFSHYDGNNNNGMKKRRHSPPESSYNNSQSMSNDHETASNHTHDSSETNTTTTTRTRSQSSKQQQRNRGYSGNSSSSNNNNNNNRLGVNNNTHNKNNASSSSPFSETNRNRNTITEEDVRFFERTKNFKQSMQDQIDSKCVIVENIPSSEVLKKVLEVDGIKQKFHYSGKSSPDYHHMIVVTLYATQRIAISQSKFARARLIFEEEYSNNNNETLGEQEEATTDNENNNLNNVANEEKKKIYENNLYWISRRMLPSIVKKPIFIASCFLPEEFERKPPQHHQDPKNTTASMSQSHSPSDKSIIFSKFAAYKPKVYNFSQDFVDATNSLFSCVSKLHPPKRGSSNIVTDCITPLFDIVDCTNELELEFAKRKGILHHHQNISQNISKKLEELIVKRKDLEQQVQKQMRKKFEVPDLEQQQQQLEQVKKEERSRNLKKQLSDLKKAQEEINNNNNSNSFSVDQKNKKQLHRHKRKATEKDLYSDEESSSDEETRSLRYEQQQLENMKKIRKYSSATSHHHQQQNHRFISDATNTSGGGTLSPSIVVSSSSATTDMGMNRTPSRQSRGGKNTSSSSGVSSPASLRRKHTSNNHNNTTAATTTTALSPASVALNDISSVSWLNDALNSGGALSGNNSSALTQNHYHSNLSSYDERLMTHQKNRTSARSDLLRKYDHVVEDRVKATERLFNAQKRLRHLREQLDHRHVEHLLEMKKRSEEIDQMFLETQYEMKRVAEERKMTTKMEIEELKSGRKFLTVEDQEAEKTENVSSSAIIRTSINRSSVGHSTTSSSVDFRQRQNKSTVPFAHHSTAMRNQRLQREARLNNSNNNDNEGDSNNNNQQNSSAFFNSSTFKNNLLRAAGVKTPDPKQMRERLLENSHHHNFSSFSASKFRINKALPSPSKKPLSSFIAFGDDNSDHQNTRIREVVDSHQKQTQELQQSQKQKNNSTSSNSLQQQNRFASQQQLAGSFRLKKGAVSVLGGSNQNNLLDDNDDDDNDYQDHQVDPSYPQAISDHHRNKSRKSTTSGGGDLTFNTSSSFGPVMQEEETKSKNTRSSSKKKNTNSSSKNNTKNTKNKNKNKKHVGFSGEDDDDDKDGDNNGTSSSEEASASSSSSSSSSDDELDLWAPMVKKSGGGGSSMMRRKSSVAMGDQDNNNLDSDDDNNNRSSDGGNRSSATLPREVLNLLRVASPSQRLTRDKKKPSKEERRQKKKALEINRQSGDANGNSNNNRQSHQFPNHASAFQQQQQQRKTGIVDNNNSLGIKEKPSEVEVRDTVILYGMLLAHCEKYMKKHLPLDDTLNDNAGMSVQLTSKTSYTRVKTLPPKYNRRYSSDPVMEAQLARVANVAETTGCRFFLNAKQQLARDYVLLIDRSRSMYNGRRWKDAEEAVRVLAPHICKFDPDGITLIFFDHEAVKIDNVMDAKEVSTLFKNHPPRGSTNLARALDIAFQDHFDGERGATTIMVVTDGRPDNTEDVKRVITEASNAIGLDGELSISIIQIGNDEGATEYLKILDDELYDCQYDIVDCLTSDDVKHISFNELVARSLFD